MAEYKPDRCCNIHAITEPERLGVFACVRAQLLNSTVTVAEGRAALERLDGREQDIMRQCVARHLSGTCLEQQLVVGPQYIEVPAHP